MLPTLRHATWTRALGPLLVLTASLSPAPAADAPGSPAASAPSTSEPFSTPTGTWRFAYALDSTPVVCRAKEEPQCIRHVLSVVNDTPDALECWSEIRYDGVNAENEAQIRAPFVVMPRGKNVTLRDTARPEAKVIGRSVSCTPHPLTGLPERKDGCAYKMTATAPLEDFYSPASRRLRERGPVVLAFTLEKPASQPSNIQLVMSSLYTRIDESAKAFLQQMQFETPCPGTRYAFVVRFELDD